MTPKSSRNPDSFADLTEKTSDLAQFIIFCLAIPTIVGIIFAGVVGILVEEPLFGGQWNLGTFIAVVLFSVPFCFYLFLKTRKKKTHQKIGESAYPRQLSFISLLIFFPQTLGYIIYIILNLFLTYDSFTTIFPVIIGVIYPFITILCLKLFQINENIHLVNQNQENSTNPDETSTEMIGESEISRKTTVQAQLYNKFTSPLQKVFLVPLILQAAVNAVVILTSENSIALAIANICLILGLLVIIWYNSKRSTPTGFKIYSLIIWIQISIVLSGMVAILVRLYSPNVHIVLFIAISVIILWKIWFILFEKLIHPVYFVYDISFNWNVGVVVNNIINFFMLGGTVVTVWLSFESAEMAALASFLFIPLVILEAKFVATKKFVYRIFLITNIFLFNVIFAFFAFPYFWTVQLGLFLILSLIGMIFLQQIHLIDPFLVNKIKTGLYVLFFLHAGFAIGYFLVGVGFTINGSIFFTYLFFMMIGGLGASYRIYLAEIPPKYKDKYLNILFGQLVLVFIGIFFLFLESAVESDFLLIPYDFLFGILDQLIPGYESLEPFGFYKIFVEFLFQKIPNLQSLNTTIPFLFKAPSNAGSAVLMVGSGFLTLALSLATVKILGKLKILPKKITFSYDFAVRYCFWGLIAISMFLCFQSITGVGIALIVWAFGTLRIVKIAVKKKWFHLDPQHNQVVKSSIILVVIVFTIFTTFMGLFELLQLGVWVALSGAMILALIFTYMSKNIYHFLRPVLPLKAATKVKSMPPEDVNPPIDSFYAILPDQHARWPLKLVQTILYAGLGVLLIPVVSNIFLFFQIEFVTNWFLILCCIFISSLLWVKGKNLLAVGHYFKESIFVKISLVLDLLRGILFYVIVAYGMAYPIRLSLEIAGVGSKFIELLSVIGIPLVVATYVFNTFAFSKTYHNRKPYQYFWRWAKICTWGLFSFAFANYLASLAHYRNFFTLFAVILAGLCMLSLFRELGQLIPGKHSLFKVIMRDIILVCYLLGITALFFIFYDLLLIPIAISIFLAIIPFLLMIHIIPQFGEVLTSKHIMIIRGISIFVESVLLIPVVLTGFQELGFELQIEFIRIIVLSGILCIIGGILYLIVELFNAKLYSERTKRLLQFVSVESFMLVLYALYSYIAYLWVRGMARIWFADYPVPTFIFIFLTPVSFLFIISTYFANSNRFKSYSKMHLAWIIQGVAGFVISGLSTVVSMSIRLNFNPLAISLLVSAFLFSLIYPIKVLSAVSRKIQKISTLLVDIIYLVNIVILDSVLFFLITNVFQASWVLGGFVGVIVLFGTLEYLPVVGKYAPKKLLAIIRAVLINAIAALVIFNGRNLIEAVLFDPFVEASWVAGFISGIIILLGLRRALHYIHSADLLSKTVSKKLTFMIDQLLLGSFFGALTTWVQVLFLNIEIPMSFTAALFATVFIMGYHTIKIIYNYTKTTQLPKILAVLVLEKALLWILAAFGYCLSIVLMTNYAISTIFLGSLIFIRAVIRSLHQVADKYPHKKDSIEILTHLITKFNLLISLPAYTYLMWDLVTSSVPLALAGGLLIHIFYTMRKDFYQVELNVALLRSYKALGAFTASLLVYYSLLELFTHNYAYFFLILTIPLLTLLYSLFQLMNGVIRERIGHFFTQIVYFLVIVDVTICVFFATQTLSMENLNWIFVTLTPIILLGIDYLNKKWLTSDELIGIPILITLGGFSVAVSLFFMGFFTATTTVLAFFYAQIIQIYSILRILVAVNKTIERKVASNALPNDEDLLHQEGSADSGDVLGEQPFLPKPYLASDYRTTKLSDGIIRHEARINIGFTIIFLVLTAYFWVTNYVSSWEIQQISVLAIAMVGLLTCAAFSNKSRKNSSVYRYFALSLSTYLFDLLFLSNFFPFNVIIRTIITIVLIFFITRFASHEVPYSALIQNLHNLAVLSLFAGIFIDLFEPSLYILIVTLCLQFTLRRSYNNLLFRTTLPAAALYVSYNYLLILSVPIYASLGSAIFIFFLLEWRLVSRDKKWHNSLLKPFLGFTVLGTALITYVAYLVAFNQVLLLVTPFVLIFTLLLLFRLRKFPRLAHRVPFYTGLTLLNSALATFAFGYIYFFGTLTNPYLASTLLTLAVNGFLFFFYYDKFEIPVKTLMVLGTLVVGAISLASLVYLFLSDPVLMTLPLPVQFSIPIALDVMIFSFYIVIGLYKRDFSREIWAEGVYLWIFVPIVNFVMISQLVSGLDFYTYAITITEDFSINGSIILTIIISTLLYLPYIITKIKLHLEKVIYGFWLELILFTIWGAINIFPDNFLVQAPFIALISLVIYTPYLYFTKKWKLLTAIWPLLAVANILFVSLFFDFDLKWEIPLGIMVFGFYLLVLAHFPNIKKGLKLGRKLLLLFSFLLIYGSIFAILYSFIVLIFIDIVISVNITIISLAFGLLLGKYFLLNEKSIKIGISALISLNLGILIARVFALIDFADFTLFGIFLGSAFFFGTVLAFQARHYLMKIYYELVWFLMALAFGLCVFEFLLSLVLIGGWGSTGTLIIVTAFIGYPIIQFKKWIPPILIKLGGVLWLVQGLINRFQVIQPYSALLFIDLELLALIVYLIFTSSSKIKILPEKKSNWEVASVLGVALSLSSALTVSLLIQNLLMVQIEDTILIFFIVLGIFGNLVQIFIRKNGLFDRVAKINKILGVIRSSLILLEYFSISLLVSLNLNIPWAMEFSSSVLGPIILKLGVWFGLLFIMFQVFDYVFHALSPMVRKHAIWISFFGMSICLLSVQFLLGVFIFLNLMMFGACNIISIKLFRRASDLRVLQEIMEYCNSLFIGGVIFAFAWPDFIAPSTLNLDFTWLFSLLCGISLLYLVMMKIKLLHPRLKAPLQLIAKALFSLFYAERIRNYGYNLWDYAPLKITLYLGYLVGIFMLLNTFKVKRDWEIYGYYGSISLAVASIVHPIISITYNLGLENRPFETLLSFAFIWSTLICILAFFLTKFNKLSKLKWLPGLNLDDSNSLKRSKHIFAIMAGAEAIIASLFGTQIFYFMFYESVYPGASMIFKIISCLQVFFILALGCSIFLTKYLLWEKILVEKEKILLKLYREIKFTFVILSSLSFVTHFWPVLDISSALQVGNFHSLAFSILLSLSITYVCMRQSWIVKRGFLSITLIMTAILSLWLEEMFRVFTESSFVFNVAIFLLILAGFNTKYVNKSWKAYTFWGIMSYGVSAVIFELYSLSNRTLEFFTSLQILLVLFAGVYTYCLYAMANHKWVSTKISDVLYHHSKKLEDKKDDQSSTSEEVTKDEKQIYKQNQPSQKIIPTILVGSSDAGKAHSFLVVGGIFDVAIITSIFSNLWAIYYSNFLVVPTENAVLFYIGSLLSTIIALIMLGLEILRRYSHQHNVHWFPTEKYPFIDKHYKFGAVVSSILFSFCHIWGILGITEHIVQLQFHTILVNLLISFLFTLVGMKNKWVNDKHYYGTKILFAGLMSLLIGEILRIFTNAKLLMIIVTILFSFTLLNIFNLKNTKERYLFWSSISIFSAYYAFSLMWGSQIASMTPIEIFSNFSALMVLFITMVYLLLAKRVLISKVSIKRLKNLGVNKEQSKESLTLESMTSLPVGSIKRKWALLRIGSLDHTVTRKNLVRCLIVETPLLIFLIIRWYNILLSPFLETLKEQYLRYIIFEFLLFLLIIALWLQLILFNLKTYELWSENKRIKSLISPATQFNGIALYLLVSLFVTFNLDVLVYQYFPLEWEILSMILTFGVCGFISVAGIDIKKLKFIRSEMANHFATICLLLIAISGSSIFYLLVENITLAFLIFSGLCFCFQFVPYMSSAIFTKIKPIIVLSLYLEIIIQGGLIIFTSFDPFLGVVIEFGLFYLLVELENKFKSITPIFPYISAMRKVAWPLFSVLLSSLGFVLFPQPVSFVQIILIGIFFTALQFKTNLIINQNNPQSKARITQVIGSFFYFLLIALIYTQLISINNNVGIYYLESLIYTRLILVSELLAVFYVIVLIDKNLTRWIPSKISHKLDVSSAIATILSLAVDAGFLIVYLMRKLPSPTPGPTPGPPPGPSGFELEYLMGPLFAFTLILAVGLHIKFKNKKLNQLMYFINYLELLIFLISLEFYAVLLIAAVFLLVVFPFVFFLEYMMRLLQDIKEYVQEIFKNLLKFFKLVVTKIYLWVKKYIKIFVTLLALGLGVVSYVYIEDIFISGLVFLAVFYLVSPERDKETTQANFLKKISYRLAVSICAFGSTNQIIPDLIEIPWIISLFFLGFFGYVIWAVRKSEELYNLSKVFRFWSSILAIVDFIITVILLLFEYVI